VITTDDGYIYIYCRGTFWRIIKHRSTEDFESLPYVCTLLNSSLWTYYGIIKPGAYLVATVNGFGILVEIIYVSLFLIYAPVKMRVAN
jgi:solute carrier family 50 protein (sugar transporter)